MIDDSKAGMIGVGGEEYWILIAPTELWACSFLALRERNRLLSIAGRSLFRSEARIAHALNFFDVGAINVYLLFYIDIYA